MINWLVYNKNDIVVADVESEDEAPYRIEMLP
jgi:hypothetical protein